MDINYLLKTSDKTWFSLLNNSEFLTILDDTMKKVGDNYYPDQINLFRFMQNPLDNVKCVIVGMDPYPSNFTYSNKIEPQATGRSFEVASISLENDWNAKFKQTSLQNILKSIYLNETGKLKA